MRIALFLPHLGHGGVERTTLNLAEGFRESGFETDLVVGKARGPLASLVPEGVNLVDLGNHGTARSIPHLASYLRRVRPEVLISSKTHVNVSAIVARAMAGDKSFHIIRECSKYQFKQRNRFRDSIYLALASVLYGRADAIVAVSRDVAEACSRSTGVDATRVVTIPDPIVTPALRARVTEHADHQFLGTGNPVFLGVGRLVPEKDFECLLRAFHLVRHRLPGATLIILGEGAERARLERTIEQLTLTESVSLPGFLANPLPFMKRASVFVLSSRSEGFPGVLIEALYAGCPVTATRCSVGVADVLEDGVLGPLVPVGDHEALASAMLRVAENPPDSNRLRRRAEKYDLKVVIEEYLRLLHASRGLR